MFQEAFMNMSAPVVAARADAEAAKRYTEPRKVLYVDDEPHAAKWFARLFGNDFDVLTACNAQDAEVVMREHGAHIAVLVSDYRMPGRSGLELLAWAQREYRHMVRILTTAYAEKEVAISAINQGRVQQILEKPLNDARTREVLHQALANFRQRERERALSDSRAVALRETLGFLAHELTTPLTTVRGYLEALLDRLQPPPADDPLGMARLEQRRAGEVLAMLEAAARRAQYTQSLISTFVQSARDAYPGVTPPSLQISQLVRTLLEEYPFEGDEHEWVSSDIVADFALPGRRDLLYLVLCTLTKNALLELRGRGQPLLHITALMQEPRADGLMPSSHLPQPALQFHDNGPGIAPEMLRRLSHEPITTRANKGGNGMGLMFCRRVMQSIGGEIDIHSTLGQGAVITLRFQPHSDSCVAVI